MSNNNGHTAQPEMSSEEAYVLEQLTDQASEDGAEAVRSEPAAHLDTARGMFVTSEGEELKLRPVRALMVERIVNGTAGKPKVPQVEVLIAGKHRRMEDNPADETYQAALAEWKQKKNETLMTYLLTAGISGTPPEVFVEESSLLFPDANDLEMKYLWVISRVPDNDIEALMEAIMGQTALTQKGLEDAAANFQ